MGRRRKISKILTMQKFILAVIIIFLSATLLAQNKILKVEYEAFHNVDRPFSEIDTLYIDVSNNRSIYRENSPWVKAGGGNKIDSITTNNEKGTSSIISTTYSKKQRYYCFDLKKDSLFSLEEMIDGDDYLVVEKIPEIKWNLTGEEKMLDKYKVFKAVCYFRGRNYTAWYSPDFPYKYGPWKFSGLPGLIFEIQDETNRYRWQIKNIAYANNPVNVFHRNTDTDGIPRITLTEYAVKRNERKPPDEKTRSKLMSILPRGAIPVFQDVTPQIQYEEMKFEWEEEENK
jgi:GLPGLI family protein